jgi:hypothetical protein
MVKYEYGKKGKKREKRKKRKKRVLIKGRNCNLFFVLL